MTASSTSLAGKVVLITGAGSGVGRALSLLLARDGAIVGLMGRQRDPLERLAREIETDGGRARALPGDVGDEAAVAHVVEQLAGAAGGLDIVVNSAGVGLYGPVEQYSLADWRQTLAANVTGLFLTSRVAIPLLRRRGGGHLVAISSGAGRRGYANLAAYSASKFAVVGFMESLAEEVGPLGIKCTTILPGSILTEFGPSTLDQKRTAAAESAKKYLLPEDVAESIVEVLRQPRHVWTQQVNVWPF